MELSSRDLEKLYGDRFIAEGDQRHTTWQVLCSRFFQNWVPTDSVVLDLAAGHCEFINNIRAARRIAVDLNPDVVRRAGEGVETHVLRSDALSAIPDDSIDRMFISNFFEHVSRDVILATLREAQRVLKPSGQLLLLQPNIRFVPRDYWRFFDHITPIDDRAMIEAFAQTGFAVIKNIPRFLPYTTKSRLPSGPLVVRLYLALPFVWHIFGAQSFMVAVPYVEGR